MSFARREQIRLAAEVSQSFCLDNGAYSAWRRGLKVDWNDYYAWVEEWRRHSSFDFAIIPDVIDGDEQANDELVNIWCRRYKEPAVGVPVWHMHESLDRLERLAFRWPAVSLWRFPRIAIGSSGEFSQVGSDIWWSRMTEAMDLLYKRQQVLYGLAPVYDVPPPRLHGLRMLNPKLFSRLPLASADSTHIARSVQFDSKWTGAYQPASKRVRGIVLADRIESVNSLGNWGQAALEHEQPEPALSSDLFEGVSLEA